MKWSGSERVINHGGISFIHRQVAWKKVSILRTGLIFFLSLPGPQQQRYPISHSHIAAIPLHPPSPLLSACARAPFVSLWPASVSYSLQQLLPALLVPWILACLLCG